MRALAFVLCAMLSGCQSTPEVNVAIGYKVSIVTVETEAQATGVPLATRIEVRTYEDIAPGTTK